MPIMIGEREWRTLAQPIRLGDGSTVREVYVNGSKVYPEDDVAYLGRYLKVLGTVTYYDSHSHEGDNGRRVDLSPPGVIFTQGGTFRDDPLMTSPSTFSGSFEALLDAGEGRKFRCDNRYRPVSFGGSCQRAFAGGHGAVSNIAAFPTESHEEMTLLAELCDEDGKELERATYGIVEGWVQYGFKVTPCGIHDLDVWHEGYFPGYDFRAITQARTAYVSGRKELGGTREGKWDTLTVGDYVNVGYTITREYYEDGPSSPVDHRDVTQETDRQYVSGVIPTTTVLYCGDELPEGVG